jgi:hypothetical protein
MGLLSMFGQAITGPGSPFAGLLGHPQPGLFTAPAAAPDQGGFNQSGFMPFGNMQPGQPPAPQAPGEHPGGIMGFVQQQMNGPAAQTHFAPPQAPDMSRPAPIQLDPGGNSGDPMPGSPLRPVSGLQQMSGGPYG